MNTLPHLEGAAVVVTGAGRGIGAAIVSRLLKAQARVLALVKPDAPVDPLLEELAHASPHRLLLLAADVLSQNDIEAVVAKAKQHFGRIDALVNKVNNAGVVKPIGPLGDVDADEWGHVLAVNAAGTMRCTQAFLPLLFESKGTIVNMSSGAAYRPLEGWSAYCASKAAMVMVARAVDLEYRERGIRVFSLGVPPTDTEMQEAIRASGINPVSKIPQHELWKPGITAALAVWLCGPEARTQIDQVEIDVRDPQFHAFIKETA